MDTAPIDDLIQLEASVKIQWLLIIRNVIRIRKVPRILAKSDRGTKRSSDNRDRKNSNFKKPLNQGSE